MNKYVIHLRDKKLWVKADKVKMDTAIVFLIGDEPIASFPLGTAWEKYTPKEGLNANCTPN